jgi:methyl-accepting chemotaxis protein
LLNDLHIHWKLSLLSALFLLPVILLTCLLVKQSTDDISFSEKERDGNRYIGVLRDTAVKLARGDGPGAAHSVADLDKIHAELGARMNLGDTAAEVGVQVRQAARQPGAGSAEAIDALGHLIERVGDGSNLILDPDLDTYYSMSLMVIKLPHALHQTVLVASAAGQVRAGGGQAAQEALRTNIGELRATMKLIERDLEGAYRGNPDGRLQIAYAAPFQRYRQLGDAYLGSVAAADDGAAQAYAQFLAQQHLVWELVSTELDRMLADRIAAFKLTLALSLGASALALGVAAMLAMLIARSISRPIDALVDLMGKIAAGDLTTPPADTHRADEIGLLSRTAAAMQEKLHSLTRQVRDTANKVEHGAQIMGSTVSERAASASNVSSTVTEIASTMEELALTSQQIAEHAKSVADIANHTWENSKRGSSAMQDLLARMGDIGNDNQGSLVEIANLGSQSKEISKVMTLINAVAAQTKLIAFNAALEASDAGEAGRRFGVVAAEIRRLADRVTESTAEIESRINEIQGAIERLVLRSEQGALGIAEGMRATASSAAQLEDLVNAASQTTEAAQQISLSTQQQKSASSQVVVALREIVDASAQGAEALATATQISTSLQASSDELRQAVGQFKLEDSGAGEAAPRQRASSREAT